MFGFKERFVKSGLLALALVACTQTPELEVGGNVTAEYTLPAKYADHRSQQQFFVFEGQSIAFTDHGEGRTLVLLHGVPTSSWMYRKVIPLLQTDLRVISIDLLGYGSSEKPADADYSEAAQARIVRALLQQLEINQYGLLVHDMGGLVAWEIMRQAPEDVTDAIILNTIVGKHGFNHPNFNPGMMTRQLMNVYSSDLSSAAVLDRTFSDLGLTGEHKLSEEECFGYVLPMREGADPALYAFFTSINEDMFQALDQKWIALKSWDGEAVVMWGAQDETLTVAQIPMLQSALSIPDAQIFQYNDNAHFLAEEIPAEIAAKAIALMQR